MFQSRDVLFIEKKFETDINECNNDNCEFFTDNVHFDMRDDKENTVLTYKNAAGTVREVCNLSKIEDHLTKLVCFQFNCWDFVYKASLLINQKRFMKL